MRIPSKTSSVSTDGFSWDTPVEDGWREAVVLFVGDSPSKSGKAMLTLELGLVPTVAGGIGGRVNHYILLEFFRERLDEVLAAFYPGVSADEGADIDHLLIRGQRCAVLVEADHSYTRRDGGVQYRVGRLTTLEEADQALPYGWRTGTELEDPSAEDGDLF